jgi:hypothetical protein
MSLEPVHTYLDGTPEGCVGDKIKTPSNETGEVQVDRYAKPTIMQQRDDWDTLAWQYGLRGTELDHFHCLADEQKRQYLLKVMQGAPLYHRDERDVTQETKETKMDEQNGGTFAPVNYQVLINGVDVTEWIIPGSIQVTLPSSYNRPTPPPVTGCFKLKNDHDAFVLTPTNICSGTQFPWERHEIAKQLLYMNKLTRNQTISNQSAEYYPLGPRSCILNKGDGVKIYSIGFNAAAIEVFSGTLAQYGVDDDVVGGGHRIVVQCGAQKFTVDSAAAKMFGNKAFVKPIQQTKVLHSAATHEEILEYYKEADKHLDEFGTPLNLSSMGNPVAKSSLGFDASLPKGEIQFTSFGQLLLKLQSEGDDAVVIYLPDRMTGEREPVITIKRWGEAVVKPGWHNRMNDLAQAFWRAVAQVYQALPLPVSPKQEAIIEFCNLHHMTLAEFDRQYYAKPLRYSGQCVEIDAWEIVKVEERNPCAEIAVNMRLLPRHNKK